MSVIDEIIEEAIKFIKENHDFVLFMWFFFSLPIYLRFFKLILRMGCVRRELKENDVENGVYIGI